jgi:hypothetical protein
MIGEKEREKRRKADGFQNEIRCVGRPTHLIFLSVLIVRNDSADLTWISTGRCSGPSGS